MNTFELNCDGIVGPTHNYAGLSFGNLASMTHKQSTSNPRQAALQGLEKMKFLMDLGIRQAVLPPHERPHMPTLRRLGFSGKDAEILEKVQRTDPALLAAVSSSSAMWTANAATVSPSADSADGRVHFTPANLVSTFHRSIETEFTSTVLKQIFESRKHFVHHDPLPCGATFADEGAANHTRLWSHESHGGAVGLQIFTYGRDVSEAPTTKFPARQTMQASRAIARLHQTKPFSTLFFKQTDEAIDAGAFHNDVVCVGHGDVLFLHEQTWEIQPVAVRQLSEIFEHVCGSRLHVIQVSNDDLPLKDAIQSYLFNSQIVTLPDGSMSLIAPIETRDNPRCRAVIEKIERGKNPIKSVHYVDVRQSMRNGGGPACLRLRVMLDQPELAAMHQGVVLTDSLYTSLRQWVEKHYREKLSGDDLADPKLLEESRTALDELSRMLELGDIYDFQR
jgi:succinylarginine dihydrolase